MSIRKYQLIGGPLCGSYVHYTKPILKVRLRAGADPLVALYRFAVNGYYHEGTKVAEDVPYNKEAEVKAAETVDTETPPKWVDKENEGTPWPKWLQWQLKK